MSREPSRGPDRVKPFEPILDDESAGSLAAFLLDSPAAPHSRSIPNGPTDNPPPHDASQPLTPESTPNQSDEDSSSRSPCDGAQPRSVDQTASVFGVPLESNYSDSALQETGAGADGRCEDGGTVIDLTTDAGLDPSDPDGEGRAVGPAPAGAVPVQAVTTTVVPEPPGPSLFEGAQASVEVPAKPEGLLAYRPSAGAVPTNLKPYDTLNGAFTSSSRPLPFIGNVVGASAGRIVPPVTPSQIPPLRQGFVVPPPDEQPTMVDLLDETDVDDLQVDIVDIAGAPWRIRDTGNVPRTVFPHADLGSPVLDARTSRELVGELAPQSNPPSAGADTVDRVDETTPEGSPSILAGAGPGGAGRSASGEKKTATANGAWTTPAIAALVMTVLLLYLLSRGPSSASDEPTSLRTDASIAASITAPSAAARRGDAGAGGPQYWSEADGDAGASADVKTPVRHARKALAAAPTAVLPDSASATPADIATPNTETSVPNRGLHEAAASEVRDESNEPTATSAAAQAEKAVSPSTATTQRLASKTETLVSYQTTDPVTDSSATTEASTTTSPVSAGLASTTSSSLQRGSVSIRPETTTTSTVAETSVPLDSTIPVTSSPRPTTTTPQVTLVPSTLVPTTWKRPGRPGIWIPRVLHRAGRQ